MCFFVNGNVNTTKHTKISDEARMGGGLGVQNPPPFHYLFLWLYFSHVLTQQCVIIYTCIALTLAPNVKNKKIHLSVYELKASSKSNKPDENCEHLIV